MKETPGPVPGTMGYAAAADSLAASYESITFEDVYGRLIRYVPDGPARALDIGAGTGRDAAALAKRGHRVTAIEPTAELRAHGRRLHAGEAITWLDGSLPDLGTLPADEGFDLILMTAVWMHLDGPERRAAMARVADLLRPGGRILMSVRRGPVPEGRRMFDVPAQDIIDDAARHGLSLLERVERGDMLGRGDVSWTLLAFER